MCSGGKVNRLVEHLAPTKSKKPVAKIVDLANELGSRKNNSVRGEKGSAELNGG